MAFISFFIINFGVAIVFGFQGYGLIAPLFLAFLVAAWNISTGWRGPDGMGAIASLGLGFLFGGGVVVVLYFIARGVAYLFGR